MFKKHQFVARNDKADHAAEQALQGNYPQVRLRRLRSADWLREMVREHNVSTSDLIQPFFVTEGVNKTETISSMPGVNRFSTDILVQEIRKSFDLGIKAFALFPLVPVEKKTLDGREALNPDNLVCRAIQEIKKAVPEAGIIADAALDPYTTHGHDGLLENGCILNDETIEILAKQSLVQAQAGADVIAPSDMMDGRVGHIRRTLDQNNLKDTLILSYAVKYASCFYGPFRDAVGSSGTLKGDKKTYQMDPANTAEALREVALDIQEGADMVMVKPGMPYLDVIRDVKTSFNIPVFAYQVSGEYAMLKAAAQNGWLNYEQALAESLLAFKRAGCSGIFTYGAADFANLLQKRA